MNKEGFRATGTLWLILALVLVGIIGLTVSIMNRQKEIPASVKQPLAVSVVKVSKGRPVQEIEVAGILEPFVETDLAAEAGGRIVELTVDEGDRVKAGDILLRIDDRLAKAALEKAEAVAADSKSDLERARRLDRTGATSIDNLDNAVLKEKTDSIRMEEARTLLEQHRVVSPIDGLVEKRNVERGEFVNRGDPVFRVIDVAKLKLIVNVPEKAVACVKAGDELEFQLGSIPGRVFKARVTFVSSQADRMTNCFQVEAIVDNGKGMLKGGMIAEVMLERPAQSDGIVVPLDAVVPKQDIYAVFVIEDAQAVLRPVKIGDIVKRSAIIVDGLDAGEQVVLDGNRALVDGDEVTVMNSDQDVDDAAE